MLFAPLLALALGAGHLTASDEGWSRVRVDVPDAATLRRLESTDLDLMECVPHLGTTDVALAPGDREKLVMEGFQFSFVSTLEDPRNWGARHPPKQVPGDEYRYNYFTDDQILAFFENYRTLYPSYVSRVSIGTSLNGETIWAYRFQRPPSSFRPPNNIVVEGLIHAREWITGSCVMHIARKVVDGLVFGLTPNFMFNQVVWIIPIVNPDGYRYTWISDRLWRKNRRPNGDGTFGVDLNRNFSKGWGGNDGSSGSPGSEVYRGTAPFSEPESQAVRTLIQSLQRVGGFIDYHSYAQMILWPWGYTTTSPPDATMYNSIGSSIQAQMNGFGVSYQQGQTSHILYTASGVSNDYVYDTWHDPSFAIELRDTGQYGFLLPATQIYSTQDEVWAGFNTFASIVGP